MLLLPYIPLFHCFWILHNTPQKAFPLSLIHPTSDRQSDTPLPQIFSYRCSINPWVFLKQIQKWHFWIFRRKCNFASVNPEGAPSKWLHWFLLPLECFLFPTSTLCSIISPFLLNYMLDSILFQFAATGWQMRSIFSSYLCYPIHIIVWLPGLLVFKPPRSFYLFLSWFSEVPLHSRYYHLCHFYC